MARLLWTQRQDMGPAQRERHAMAYDSARQRTVLFGGIQARPTQLAGDTWEWNGEYWTQVEDIGPRPRRSHVMVYDVARAQVILFGGLIGPGVNGETWAWDGQAWTQLADIGPSSRYASCMAYDSVRERVMLFGGTGGTGGAGGEQETWEWDGVEWTQRADDGPPGRSDAAMAYDEIRQRLVVFGGASAGNLKLHDTWEFDGVVWTHVADTGPGPRHSAAMAFSGTRTILFGGFSLAADGLNNHSLKDTWEWSGKFWTQRQDIGPSDRGGHTMAYDSNRDKTVMFGGFQIPNPNPAENYLNDTWELPGSSITLSALTLPRPIVSNGVATLLLSGPSPIGGITVSLGSTGPIEVPGSIFVVEGRTSAEFRVKLGGSGAAVPPAPVASVTAKLGASRITAEVHLEA